MERTVTIGFSELVKIESDKESAEHLVGVLRNTLKRKEAEIDGFRSAQADLLSTLGKIAQITERANVGDDHPWLLIRNICLIANDSIKLYQADLNGQEAE